MIPTDFRLKMQRMYGDSGITWTGKAEKLMLTLKHRLNLSYGEPFSLSYNFVVPVLLNNHRSGVLKVGYPNQDFNNEFHALCDFQGRGIVSVMDYNQEEGWILLEHLKPGTPLHTLASEGEVVRVFASVANRLWHMPKDPTPYPTVQTWSKGLNRLRHQFHGGTGPLPEEMVEKAELLFPQLLSTSNDLYLLHGDLHHDNILYSDSFGWTVIDPKGLLGEREYDCIQFLLNYWKDRENPLELLKFRTTQMASLLSLSYERLIAYGFCHSILSACWCVEDGGDCWENGIQLARLFEILMNE